jgi:hypothetical protein
MRNTIDMVVLAERDGKLANDFYVSLYNWKNLDGNVKEVSGTTC